MKDLKTILKEAPKNGPYGKTAYYSAHCVWWTSDPDDLGNTKDRNGYPVGMKIINRDGSETVIGEDHPGLPCCPHCGSVLFQADLEKFINSARENSENYGPYGIEAFTKAHHQNFNSCARSWVPINNLLDVDRIRNP